MYTNNELMFPHYAIPRLRDARGAAWSALIDRLSTLPETHEEVLAFMLVMIRLNGCLPCETDSYRAMRGCSICTLQTLRHFKGSDDELLTMYQEALVDMRRYLAQAETPRIVLSLMQEAV